MFPLPLAFSVRRDRLQALRPRILEGSVLCCPRPRVHLLWRGKRAQGVPCLTESRDGWLAILDPPFLNVVTFVARSHVGTHQVTPCSDAFTVGMSSLPLTLGK